MYIEFIIIYVALGILLLLAIINMILLAGVSKKLGKGQTGASRGTMPIGSASAGPALVFCTKCATPFAGNERACPKCGTPRW